MDLQIMDLYHALYHHPKKPTYAIRIICTGCYMHPLQESELYRKIVEYTFDDNDTYPEEFVMGPTWFDEQIAGEIIKGFAEHRNSVEALLVHCTAGKNRSPAVAIALNEVFDLGQNTNALKQKYGKYNRFVYETMIKAAQEISQ